MQQSLLERGSVMTIAAEAGLGHWFILAIFFTIFAVCGMTRKNSAQATPSHYIALGTIAVVINTALLFFANRAGYGSFDLLDLITLREAAIESSFIILGYCMMIYGIGNLLRTTFYASMLRSDKTYF